MLIHANPLAATAAAMKDGRIELTAYIEELCERIDAQDRQIQALLPEPDRRQRLFREAAELSRRYPEPARRPPLFGIPVGVKDIIRVDSFPTRAGTSLPEQLFAGPEASVVRALRSAGALILGKTATTEFAFFEPGPTRNPHNPAHTPGGSSSGSAAAVAAGYCPLALGTQTIASINRPAAYCGIFGFKPSYGRVPMDGVIPFSESADTLGFFTQDVAGIELAAAVLCHNWSLSQNDGPPVLGVPTGAYLEQAEPSSVRFFEAAMARLEEAGFEIFQVPTLEDIEEINRRHLDMIAAELAQVHSTWFSQYCHLYRPRTAELIQHGRTVDRKTVDRARASRGALQERLGKLMDALGIDLWVTPGALGPAPAGLQSTGDPKMSLPWTHAGMPTLSLPAGKTENRLPLGIQLIATIMDDERLVHWAREISLALTSD